MRMQRRDCWDCAATVHIYRGPPEKKGGDGNPGHIHHLTRHNHWNSKIQGGKPLIMLLLG